MDKDILQSAFVLGATPMWICPSCEKGILHIDANTFNCRISAKSNALIHEGLWEYDNAEKIFCCILTCSNVACKKQVACCGEGLYAYEADGGLVELFSPKYFLPNLKLISLPNNCPEVIKTALNESFKNFFSSPNSAANSIRISLEELMTVLGVQRYTNKNGRRNRLLLHNRINKLPEKYDEIKDMLYAVKWIGNDGSHNNNIPLVDIISSYEIMEYVLDLIYNKKMTHLNAFAKKIIKKKR